MDLEQLNKTQIVLLTLFVSFVTSIATGIVTVSLMNQAPPQVEAAVNHIIERTVQQVAAPSQAASPATVKTVVVKNDDLAAQSIAAVQKSMIRIASADKPDLLVARAIVIDAKGVALTDRGSLDPDGKYEAILPGGARVPASVRSASTSTPVVLVDLALGTSTPPLTAAIFADPSKLSLGQTVIRIGGAGADTVGEGVIASLPESKDANLQKVEATVESSTPGSVLITLFGEVVGIVTADSADSGSDFYSMPNIFKAASQAPDASTVGKQAPKGTGSSH